MTQAEAVELWVEEFSRLGFIYFCIAPGSRSTPLVLSSVRHPKIKTRVFHDERSMAYFALGLSRAGQIPVILTTSGTALANIYPALIEAKQDAQKLIVLSADRPEEELGKGGNQTIIQKGIFASYATTLTISEHAEARELLNIAGQVYDEITQNPGPLHINFPLRKPLEELASRPLSFSDPDLSRWWGSDLAWPRDVVESKRLPFGTLKSRVHDYDAVIVGANFPGCSKEISEALVDFNGDTFFDIQSGSWTLGSRALSSEVFGKWGDISDNKVLVLGHRFTEHRVWNSLVSVDYVEQWKTIEGCFDPLGVVSKFLDISFAKDTSSVRLDGQEGEPLKEKLPLSYSKIVSYVYQYQDRFDSIYLANSLTIRAFDRFRPLGPFQIGAKVFCNRGTSGIDGTLATGLGVASVSQRTLIVCGDHAFLYDLPLLADLKKWDINVTIIIVDNKGGHIFDHLPIAKFDILDEYYVADPDVNLEKIVGAFGFKVDRVDDTQAFVECLNKDSSGTNFIIAKVDPDFDLSDFSSTTQARYS